MSDPEVEQVDVRQADVEQADGEHREGVRALDGFFAALGDDDAGELYDRAPCGYLSTTPDGTIIKVNQTLLALTGYSRADLVERRRFADLLSRGGQMYHETHYAPMLRMHGVAREIALTIVRKDGSRLPALVNSVLERDAAGAPRVVRTAVFDATQRREYERELLAAKERAERSEARASALARTLQQTLIPPAPPVVPHLDVAAGYRPAGDGSQVGGDFYDVFQVGVDDWVVVIGDVCGKGAEAAVVTALARYTLRAAAVEHPQPSEALRLLNEVLQRQGTARFCTVAALRLRRFRGGWSAVVACGGHAPPLLRDVDGGVRTIGRPGSLLGVVDEPELHDVDFALGPGQSLLLFTDGVTEARNGAEFYGDSRVEVLAAGPHDTAGSLAGSLLADVLSFQSGQARDDIAVVVLRVPPPPDPAALAHGQSA